MKKTRWSACAYALLPALAAACREKAVHDPPDAHVASPSVAVSAPPAELSPRSLDSDPPSDAVQAERVRLGARIFADTPKYATAYVGNDLACTSCHLDSGQKAGALPLNGVEAVYPAFQKRLNRVTTLEERIQGCFLRSENGTAPRTGSAVLDAVVAYVTWLSAGWPRGVAPAWRGSNRIAEIAEAPVRDIDVKDGARLFGERCASCHGADGRGEASARGVDPSGHASGLRRPAPLWGPRSFNDGAGLARVYTLAGFVRWAMPLGAAGTLTDGQSLAIAGFIDSKERPVFAAKSADFPDAGPPEDGVYYESRYAENPLRK